MNKKFLLLLLILVFVTPIVSATDIMGNFTSIDSDGDFVDYVIAFDSSLSNYAVFSIIIGIIIVVTAAINTWNDDFISSLVFALFLGTFVSLLCAVIVNDAGVRLLSWEKFSLIATLLVLSSIYKKVSEQ